MHQAQPGNSFMANPFRARVAICGGQFAAATFTLRLIAAMLVTETRVRLMHFSEAGFRLPSVQARLTIYPQHSPWGVVEAKRMSDQSLDSLL